MVRLWFEAVGLQALRAAGGEGLDTGALVEAVTAAGVKSWEDMRIAKSSVASSCTHDPAFARLQKGRFALRALRPDLEVSAFELLPLCPSKHQSAQRCIRGESAAEG